jgi:hypothetical protein
MAGSLLVFLGMLIEMTDMSRAMVGFLVGLLGHVLPADRGDVFRVRHLRRRGGDMATVAPAYF